MIKFSSLGLASLALLVSCVGGQKNKQEEGNTLLWDSVQYETVLSINNDSIRYDVEHTFLYPKNDSVLYHLNLQKVFGDNVADLEPDSLVKLMTYSFVEEEDKGLGFVEMDSISASQPREVREEWGAYPDYNFFNQNTLMYADDEVVSIQYYSYAYLGGAHGMGAYYYLPYDRVKKEVITEADLFDEANRGDFDEVFTKLLIEKMKMEYETYDPEEPMWQSLENVKPNGNFYLTKHSLVYQFNHYEIGAYALGTPVLEIPYDLIQNLVKEDSPIARIIKAKN